jgi:hypothetical protein
VYLNRSARARARVKSIINPFHSVPFRFETDSIHPGGWDQKTRRTVYPYEIRSGKSSRFPFFPSSKTSHRSPKKQALKNRILSINFP